MNQALRDTTPTRWADQGPVVARLASKVEEPAHATIDRPLGRKGKRRAFPPTPVVTERTEPSTDRETPAARRPDKAVRSNSGAGRARSTWETARREAAAARHGKGARAGTLGSNQPAGETRTPRPPSSRLWPRTPGGHSAAKETGGRARFRIPRTEAPRGERSLAESTGCFRRLGSFPARSVPSSSPSTL